MIAVFRSIGDFSLKFARLVISASLENERSFDIIKVHKTIADLVTSGIEIRKEMDQWLFEIASKSWIKWEEFASQLARKLSGENTDYKICWEERNGLVESVESTRESLKEVNSKIRELQDGKK